MVDSILTAAPYRFRRPSGVVTGYGPTVLATQPSSLIVYAPCNDVGAPLNNQVSGQPNLAERGTSGWTYQVAGLLGDCVQGNGNGGWQTASDVSLDPSNGQTHMCLLFNDTGVDDTCIMSAGDLADDLKLMMANGSVGAPGLSIRSRARTGVSSNDINSADTVFSANAWHHVVWRARTASQGATGGGGFPDDCDVIVNNVKTTVANTTWLSAIQSRIGLCTRIASAAPTHWSGRIQHYSVWNTALTDAEISNIFAQTGL